MAVLDIDLGEADVTCVESGVHITLSSSAQLTPSAADDIAQLKRGLTKHSLTRLPTDLPFIKPNSTLELNVVFELDSVLDTDGTDQLVYVLSERLQNAELWRQLCLRPTSARSSFGTTRHRCTITICLAHDTRTAPVNQVHQLAKDVPFHDVQAPPGVSRAICESIRLIFSVRRAHQKRRCAYGLSGAGRSPACSHEYDAEVESDDDLLSEIPHQVLRDVTSLSSEEVQAHVSIANDSDEDFDDLYMLLDDEDMLSVEDISPPSAPPAKRKMSSSAQESDLHLCTDALTEAIDVAFRLAISGSATRVPKGFKVCPKDSFQPLAEVMPAMWSPEYHRTLASRAVLMPTIARALGSVPGRMKRGSGDYPARDSRSSERSSSDAYAAFSTNYFSNPATQPLPTSRIGQLHAQLWNFSQSKLYSPTSARRLRPLSEGATLLLDNEQPGFDDLLDLPHALLEEPELLGSDELDLLSDEDLACFESQTFEDLAKDDSDVHEDLAEDQCEDSDFDFD